MDIDRKRAHGEAMDISHGTSFSPPCRVYDGTYDDLLDNVDVALPIDDNSFNVTIGNEFTAVSGETYICSFVGYVNGVPVCKDVCCVVGGFY